MTLDQNVLWCTGIGAEVAVVALLLYKRAYKIFPIFCACIAWGLFTDVGYYAASQFYSANYLEIYIVGMTVESLLEFGVLVELAWSVLRPLRLALPRWAIVAVALVIGGICAAIWPFATSTAFSRYSLESRLLIHMQQTFSIMRVLFFLVLAGCSQLLSISWRDRELQIATGLGFYSIVSVVVSILQAGQTVGPIYVHLNEIVAVSYLCSVLYWIYSFSTKEAPRTQFTPQMQSFLLAVAGAARSTRVSLTEAREQTGRKVDE